MRPSNKLLRYLLIWLGFATVVFVVRLSNGPTLFESMWWISSIILLLIFALDALLHRSFGEILLERELPRSLALSVSAKVKLHLTNPYYFPLKITLSDYFPHQVTAPELPVKFSLAAQSSKDITYKITPNSRGEAEFGKTCLLIETRWGFWQKLALVGTSATLKIYPNFAPIAHFASVGLEHQIAKLGIHLQQRRGEGSDFHQLREYREGDSMRQVDWKASARHRKLISRDYQDERDQDIVFLLDCGRRMRNKDSLISHFDHSLNALLLTAYVALRQGDSVGLLSFAGKDRWMPPIKGPGKINTLLNQLYDLHSTTMTSDYLHAAEQLLSQHNKRSLIVLISNIQETDIDDLSAAARLLSKKHVVLIASLRDAFVDETLSHTIASFDDALSYCGTVEFSETRRKILTQLHNSGVIIIDSLPQNLHIDLVNEYLKVKHSGRL